jgi:phosphohistidine phosphatase
MVFYLLRHGLAGQHGDPRYKDDSLRPLTEEGMRKMQGASKGMKNLNLQFDAILSSPYLRARQTAEIVAKVYKIKKVHLTENLLPPCPARHLLKEITEHFPTAETILAVGHEPHLTQLISEFLKSDQHLNIDFKKGALVSLNVPPSPRSPATLNWLLTSSQLSLMQKQ